MGQSFITVTSSYWECIYTYAEAVGQDAIVGKSNMKNQDAPPNVSIEFLFLLTIADTFYYFEVGFEITILLIALYLISLSNISSMLKMVVKYHTCICNGIAVASQTSGSRRWSQGWSSNWAWSWHSIIMLVFIWANSRRTGYWWRCYATTIPTYIHLQDFFTLLKSVWNSVSIDF